jgi:hypothetical protein
MSIRRLTVLEALRTLEAMAGQAILHIMPWSSLLCSICKMWKQPVGYCFICGSINPLNAELNPICLLLALFGAHHIPHVSRITVKGETLVIFFMEVLDACHNIRLVVIATVFDMSANNVKVF